MSIALQKAPGKPNMPNKHRYYPSRREGLSIQYKLKVSGESFASIGKRLHLARQVVFRVVFGLCSSARIESEIARILGKADWNEVVMDARCEVQKKPVEVIVRENEERLRAERDALIEGFNDHMTEQNSKDWTAYEEAYDRRTGMGASA